MKKIVVFILCVCIASFSCRPVRAAEVQKKLLPDSRPIEITADRLEAYDEKKVILFTGNAVAVQGDRVIKAENILLYYKKDDRSGGREGVQGMGKTGELVKIEASGRVAVNQGDRSVTGDKAVYYQDAQKIVVTGNAVMRQGDSIVRGDTIEVFLAENKGIVEAGENKRVKAVIYPSQYKEEKK